MRPRSGAPGKARARATARCFACRLGPTGSPCRRRSSCPAQTPSSLRRERRSRRRRAVAAPIGAPRPRALRLGEADFFVGNHGERPTGAAARGMRRGSARRRRSAGATPASPARRGVDTPRRRRSLSPASGGEGPRPAQPVGRRASWRTPYGSTDEGLAKHSGDRRVTRRAWRPGDPLVRASVTGAPAFPCQGESGRSFMTRIYLTFTRRRRRTSARNGAFG